MLWVGVLANSAALVAIPLWARLSDRIGRKPVFVAGALGSGVMIFVYLWAISTGSLPLVFLTGILLFGVVYSASNGIWPSLYGEMFTARVRLSGMAVGTQIGFAVAGFAVSFAEQIAGPGGDGWIGVAAFTAVICAVSAIAALTAGSDCEGGGSLFAAVPLIRNARHKALRSRARALRSRGSSASPSLARILMSAPLHQPATVGRSCVLVIATALPNRSFMPRTAASRVLLTVQPCATTSACGARSVGRA